MLGMKAVSCITAGMIPDAAHVGLGLQNLARRDSETPCLK